MLLALRHQFDAVMPHTAEFGQYDLLLVPDKATVTSDLAAQLRAFVAQGGRLLLSHQALLDRDAGTLALADALGVDYLGSAPSVPDYLVVGIYSTLDFCRATSSEVVGDAKIVSANKSWDKSSGVW
jgi:hypothetical protein